MRRQIIGYPPGSDVLASRLTEIQRSSLATMRWSPPSLITPIALSCPLREMGCQPDSGATSRPTPTRPSPPAATRWPPPPLATPTRRCLLFRQLSPSPPRARRGQAAAALTDLAFERWPRETQQASMTDAQSRADDTCSL